MGDLVKIKKLLKNNKNRLKREFHVKELGVFGSYVRGDQKKSSDVDVLVAFTRTPGFIDYIKMENRLSGILKKRVDLVMKGSLKPTIGKHIMREVVYV